jgi:proliferating cell nuclear antigen
MTFKITLSDTDLLLNSVPIIAEIIDEGVFKVNQNGLSMLSPDRTMVAVVDFRLLSSAFEEFKVESEASLGLNLSNLVAVLKRVRRGDKLTLQMGEKNRLEVIVEGNGKRRFEIPLLDIKTEKPPIDQLSFPSRIELETNVLEDGIADADVVSDSIVLEAGAEKFRMWAKGDVSSAELEMKKGDSGLLNITAQSNVKARYPLEYLKKMIKASKLSKQALVEFGTDYPMRMEFKVIDKVNLKFILAPRISEE